MATRIEAFDDLISGEAPYSRAYLFFEDEPPELWVAEAHEEHRDVLDDSGRKREDIDLAGGILAVENIVVIDGAGSGSLAQTRRGIVFAGDPRMVARYIENLPGAEGKIIKTI